MDFLHDEASIIDDAGVLLPSSQASEGYRPRKRRRKSEDHDDYDLPSNNYHHEEDVDVDTLQYRSKYENVMHVVQHADTQKETFVTQLTQPWSSPTRIRGPRWLKKTPSPSPTPNLRSRNQTDCSARGSPALAGDRLERSWSRPLSQPASRDEFDDDDPALLEAFMPSPLDYTESPRISLAPSRASNTVHRQGNTAASMRQTTLFGTKPTQQSAHSTQSGRAHNWPLVSRKEVPTHHQIDTEAMTTWTYPINLGRIRDYQYNIVHKSLFSNLLVALPTGLGKTFIAATVMLNWFRWTKKAQIVFVAPTRPLVNQQAEACYGIAGIPKHETIILTGEVNSVVRAEDWEEKRVFFMTPQTLINDLESGRADPKKVVLLVVDEAHKATGNYAYIQVVKFLRKYNSSFRVLALTATPGGTVDAVQKVIDGLDIARVEIRTEDSIDIRDFVHARDVQLEIFDNSEELSTALELFAAAVGPVLSQLASQNAYWGRDPTSITLFGLRKAQIEWRKSDAGKKAGFGTQSWINSMFRPLMTLAHNLELLKFHGISPFYHKMKSFEDESHALGKFAKQIASDQHFKKLMNYMRAWVSNPEFVGHPKLEYLKQVVLNHFMDADETQISASGRAAADTRIMIFAHYRDSAEEVVRVLKRHNPIVKPHIFVGQSGTKGSEGMNQKTQLEVLTHFKNGTYNTLVATSIGEEGLDIGEVDLIVCYDSSKSPIRMLQRMGRTGRKRAGKIAVLLMRGKEENDYYRAKDSYQKMQELIESGQEFTFHDDRSPRIVPKEIIPVVDKKIVDIPVENTQGPLPDHSKRKPTKCQKRAPKKFNMPDGVETGIKFLGCGGKKSRAQQSPPLPVFDLHEAVLPSLNQVVLTPEAQVQLETNYQQIAGTHPQYIESISLDAFPENQRALKRTARVGHSTSTQALVSAWQGMRARDRNWTRPTTEVMLEVNRILTNRNGVVTREQRVMTKRQQGVLKASSSLQSSDSQTLQEDEYADSLENESTHNDSPSTSPDVSALLQPIKKTVSVVDPPHKRVQRYDPNSEQPGEDEFPELEDLFGATHETNRHVLSSTVSKVDQLGAKRRSSRRIVDSDDEE